MKSLAQIVRARDLLNAIGEGKLNTSGKFEAAFEVVTSSIACAAIDWVLDGPRAVGFASLLQVIEEQIKVQRIDVPCADTPPPPLIQGGQG